MADHSCPDCERSFTTKKGLAVHRGMVHKDETEDRVEGTATVEGGDSEEFTYPQLGDLPKMDEEEVPEGGAEGAEKTGGVAGEEEAKTVAKPAPEPVRLELSNLWKLLGNLIDKENPITDEEAKALNDSLNSLGLATIPSADPILIPNWAPVVLTIISVFGARILSKYGESFFENIKKRMTEKLSPGMVKKKEEEEEET